MQQLVSALNDIKRDLNVITQKLAAVDRVIKTGDVSHLMRPIQGSQSQQSFVPNSQFGPQQQIFGQQTGSIPGLWGSGSGGGRRRNRKRGQKNLFGGNQGVSPQSQAYAAQQAQLTAQYLQQMLSQNGQQGPRVGS